jgi:hypothetical protein
MKKINLKDIKNSHGSTNWTTVRKQTDAEIKEAALKSQDAKLLSVLELAQLRRAGSEQGAQ